MKVKRERVSKILSASEMMREHQVPTRVRRSFDQKGNSSIFGREDVEWASVEEVQVGVVVGVEEKVGSRRHGFLEVGHEEDV